MFMRKKRAGIRRAFTLLEVLLAIAMISLLSFIVVSNMDTLMTGGQTSITKSFVNSSLSAPMMSYKLAMGRYPTTEEGLVALISEPANSDGRWQGPYIRELPKDPWGNDYMYRCPAEKSKDGFDVWSMGPDGKDGTDDDIGNW